MFFQRNLSNSQLILIFGPSGQISPSPSGPKIKVNKTCIYFLLSLVIVYLLVMFDTDYYYRKTLCISYCLKIWYKEVHLKKCNAITSRRKCRHSDNFLALIFSMPKCNFGHESVKNITFRFNSIGLLYYISSNIKAEISIF